MTISDSPVQKDTTVELHEYGAIEPIEELKLRSNLSSIRFVLLQGENQVNGYGKVIDSLVDLLNTNHNVKSLYCDVSFGATAYLMEALAKGLAGDSLESLQIRGVHRSRGITSLERYLKTNRDLKRLCIDIHNKSPATKALLSTIVCSTLLQLELDVLHSHGFLRELGTKLGDANSICYLKLLFHDDISEQFCDIESLFKEGLATMHCLAHVEIRCCNKNIAHPLQDGMLGLIKSSNSIQEASLQPEAWTSLSFRDELESYCILNRVFGSNLIGFEPTELWTRVVLAKLRGDSGRATFLFRLLREKPELVIAGNMQSTCCISAKRQRLLTFDGIHNVGPGQP